VYLKSGAASSAFDFAFFAPPEVSSLSPPRATIDGRAPDGLSNPKPWTLKNTKLKE